MRCLTLVVADVRLPLELGLLAVERPAGVRQLHADVVASLLRIVRKLRVLEEFATLVFLVYDRLDLVGGVVVQHLAWLQPL
eukprot:11032034-Alexandrium_andersonii.AAC.1